MGTHLERSTDAPTTSQATDSCNNVSKSTNDYRIYPTSKPLLFYQATEFSGTMLKAQRYNLLESGLNMTDSSDDWWINVVAKS